MMYTMYTSKSFTKYILTMSKVPLKSLNNISIEYYIYDINSRLIIKTNYKMCKTLSGILRYRISDIVAFCGIYRYAVWSINEWIKITKEMKDGKVD